MSPALRPSTYGFGRLFDAVQDVQPQRVLGGGLLLFLLGASFERLIGLVFVLNFSVDGLNATALWSLGVLCAPVVLLPVRHVTRWFMLSVPVLVLGSYLELATVALGSTVLLHAVLVWRMATRPWTAHEAALAVALGWALRIAITAWNGGAALYATTGGFVSLILVSLAWYFLARKSADAPRLENGHGMAVWLATVAGVALIASPAAAWRWFDSGPVTTTALLSVGVAAGALWAVFEAKNTDGGRRARAARVLGAVGLLWAMLSPLLPAAGVSLLAACAIVAMTSRREASWRMLLAAQAFVLVSVFLLIVAANWAFVAGIGDVVHGRAPLLMALLLLAALPAGRVRLRPLPRRSGVAWLPVVVAGFALLPFLAVSPPVPGEPVDHLRVGTWNVHQYYDGELEGAYGLQAQAETLARARLHIVGLTETEGARITSGGMDGVRYLAEHLGMYHAQGPATSEMTYGVGLLAAWPIDDISVLELPRRGTMERVALLATVEAPDGPIRVAVPHFEIDLHPEARAAQAEALRAAVAAGPDFGGRVLILGDLNTPVEDAVYDQLNATWRDAWVEAEGTRLGNTHPVPGPATVRIDHIWMGFHWQALRAQTFGTAEASDHHGVWATLVAA